ncbi:MAG: class I SAM-dependent methyltransferase [Bdellovibrio sp.]|nr:class I SAM-dependent methyltransferase [Bdellovibrio sp.]
MAKAKTKKKSLVKVGPKTVLPFDKYAFYHEAVQSPDADVEFYEKAFKEIHKNKKLTTLREDFCAAGAISCEWVKLNKNYKSCGLDLDPEPMAYGREHYFPKLTKEEQGRAVLIQKNVLEKNLPVADMVAAVNFSYCLFKKREELKQYFENVYKSLNGPGLFITDIFGGSQCGDAIEDRHKFKNFTYYWDQKGFDPVSAEGLFQIHFRHKGTKYENVFTYDWRMWTIPELKELMLEAGFEDIKVYWEGTNKKGGGSGIFKQVEKGEPCLSWIAYVIGVKNK